MFCSVYAVLSFSEVYILDKEKHFPNSESCFQFWLFFSMQFLDSNLLPHHQNSLTSALLESVTFSVLSPLAWHVGCWGHRLASWWDWNRRAADLLWGRRACPLAQPGALCGYCPSISPNFTPNSGLRSSQLLPASQTCLETACLLLPTWLSLTHDTAAALPDGKHLPNLK